MLINRITPVIYYAGPADPTGGGGGAAAVAEPPAPQPVQGQGGEGAADNGNFWGMFPNVPEEHRALLEPHLRENVLPHVTRLEQQLAPLKPIIDAGYNPEQVQGLVKFSQDFDANPLESWLKLGAALQQPDPTTGQSIIHGDLDLEILTKIAMGQPLPDDEGEQGSPEGVQPGQPQPVDTGQGLEGIPPQLQEMVQGLQTRLDASQAALEELQNARQQDQSQAQQAAQARLLNQQMGTMKDTLTKAGYPADLLEGESGEGLLRSALITANGNAQGAIKLLQDQRSAILKGFTNTSGQPGELDLSGGTPPTPTRTRSPRDGFEKARPGAAAFLKRQRSAAAQG